MNLVPTKKCDDPLLDKGDEKLNETISHLLPSNYNFEIQKTLQTIRTHRVRRVGLQMPEGLQMFAMNICTILKQFAYPSTPKSEISKNTSTSLKSTDDQPTGLDLHPSKQVSDLETVILGDVTYGACCIDDYTARALQCDLLVHYGHSCLIPVTNTPIRTLYVFVDIQFDVQHFIQTLKMNFPDRSMRLAMVGTVQFVATLQAILTKLRQEEGYSNISIPQIKPLSPGEVLGCTAPRLTNGEEAVMYVRNRT
jgi:2-(3-amino-3-carboxypropyl)histidine synthase